MPGSYYDEFLAIAGVLYNDPSTNMQPAQVNAIEVLFRNDILEANDPLFTLVVPFANDEQHLPACLGPVAETLRLSSSIPAHPTAHLSW